MRLLNQLCGTAAVLLLAGAVRAAETLPPVPAHYFNDYANVVPAATVAQLNTKLEEFERTTSCQVVVAIFPKLQSASALEDYTHRLATAWKIGQKDKSNGVGLFVFVQDRKLRIEVGYGLEGALPDVLAKRIIEDEIKPHFKAGNYAAGLSAGVDAILKATRGEYKGSGRTVADQAPVSLFLTYLPFGLILIFLLFLLFYGLRHPSGTVYHRGGGRYWGGATWGGGGGWSSGGSSWGGGGFSGGGDFSGGGGSFGGGGASGSW